jgi:hypothetical protein
MVSTNTWIYAWRFELYWCNKEQKCYVKCHDFFTFVEWVQQKFLKPQKT